MDGVMWSGTLWVGTALREIVVWQITARQESDKANRNTKRPGKLGRSSAAPVHDGASYSEASLPGMK